MIIWSQFLHLMCDSTQLLVNLLIIIHCEWSVICKIVMSKYHKRLTEAQCKTCWMNYKISMNLLKLNYCVVLLK